MFVGRAQVRAGVHHRACLCQDQSERQQRAGECAAPAPSQETAESHTGKYSLPEGRP
jgi:hypothetical protein